MGKWLKYNFVAGVFTQRNFVADFIRLKFNFIKRKQKIVFKPHFGRLRGNAHTLSIADRKACGQLPVRHN